MGYTDGFTVQGSLKNMVGVEWTAFPSTDDSLNYQSEFSISDGNLLCNFLKRHIIPYAKIGPDTETISDAAKEAEEKCIVIVSAASAAKIEVLYHLQVAGKTLQESCA